MPKRLALVLAVVALAWLPIVHSLLSRPTEPAPAASDTSASQLTAAADPAPTQPAPKPVLKFAPMQPPPAPAAPTPAPVPEKDPFEEVSQRPAKFRDTFESETRDAFWANEQEPNLQHMLEAVEFTPEEYSEVACRRTVCRVTFKRPRISESRAIALYARVLTGFGDAQLVLHDADTDKQGQIYVLRKDYKLESPRAK
jgi:hypothetical protein